jgi:hypothetical protein
MSGFFTISRPGNINQIQRVTVSIASGVTSGSATITAVNTALSEIFNLGCTMVAGQSIPVRVDLINSTTVGAYLQTSVGSGAPTVVGIQVTEHKG